MKKEKQVVFSHPILSKMWMSKNQLKPQNTPLYSREKAWWKCRVCQYEFERSISYQVKKNGQCPRCHLAYQNKDHHLGITHPEVARSLISKHNEGWEAIHLTASSNRKLWWKCGNCDSIYSTRVSERVKTNRCVYCSGRSVSHLNSLASKNPELSREWHPTLNGDVTPNEVAVNSNRIFWWKCFDCGHSWKSSCRTRNLKRTKCPSCEKKRRLTVGFYQKRESSKSLATKFPEIAQQWDVKKNQTLTPSDVGPYSQKKVWWTCDSCSHSWLTSVIKRTQTIKGSRCPSCQKNFLIKEQTINA